VPVYKWTGGLFLKFAQSFFELLGKKKTSLANAGGLELFLTADDRILPPEDKNFKLLSSDPSPDDLPRASDKVVLCRLWPLCLQLPGRSFDYRRDGSKNCSCAIGNPAHLSLQRLQGAVRPSHLDYYLDEFTFRFNRRTPGSRGKPFYRLAQQAMMIEPVPAKTVFGERGET